MARWILDRPKEFSDSTELMVAEWLAELPDSWVIRWGFSYLDSAGLAREGDFLILGPQGGLLVMEVKGGRLHHLVDSGRWNTENKDHPIAQLMREWRAVLDKVGAESSKEYPPLFVEKVLAVPQLHLEEDATSYLGIERKLIFTGSDLRNFQDSWNRLFHFSGIRFDSRQREQFFRSYGAEATAKSITHFVTETERILIRQTEANYGLLDSLRENRQFLVKGGSGSGKTWLAFELACRWAQETGGAVLFLCYNLAFADLMEELARTAKNRGRPKRGEVVVRSWERLAAEVLEAVGGYEAPDDPEDRDEFFMRTVPELLIDVVGEGLVEPRFSAIVVDEAQDHDTELIGAPDDWNGPGWWGVYWPLLEDGRNGRVALFYDAAQRPSFREPGRFDPEKLAQVLPGAVRVELQETVRYTEPIFRFLKELESEATRPLLAGLTEGSSFPDGPDVRIVEARKGTALEAIEQILTEWIGNGYCKAEDVLILSPRANSERSSVGNLVQIGEWRIVDYLNRKPGCIQTTSVNKAKGLDSLAVILVDFQRFEEIDDPGYQTSFFMGASRARQLLAIVVEEKVQNTAGPKKLLETIE
ncbi:MAG TPA: NERD domain-containing protein [Opitutales bacterium]|nr:NERD domain-containing protein [Opitutales bacterium]